MSYIPKMHAKYCDAINDGVRSAPGPQHLSTLKSDINLVARHVLSSCVSEDVGGMHEFARRFVNDVLVKIEAVSMRNTITQVSNYFCFGCVTEISVRTKSIAHAEQCSQKPDPIKIPPYLSFLTFFQEVVEPHDHGVSVAAWNANNWHGLSGLYRRSQCFCPVVSRHEHRCYVAKVL
jgi:hypothetical protein